MAALATLLVTLLYFLGKACAGSLRRKRDEYAARRRWLADVRAIQALEAKGWTPIDQHERLISEVEGRWN